MPFSALDMGYKKMLLIKQLISKRTHFLLCYSIYTDGEHMQDEINNKLSEFHEYDDEAKKHFRAHELKPGQPIYYHTESDMMDYSKWRTKADIALNEFHALQVKLHPNKLPWSLKQLSDEHSELINKLNTAENWLKEHNA